MQRNILTGDCKWEVPDEEDFDRSAYGIHNGEEFDLVTSIATLTIEPRVEMGYWILETVVECSLGLLRTSQEYELTRRELTLMSLRRNCALPS